MLYRNARISLAILIGLATLICGSIISGAAFACGRWDIVCEARETIKAPGTKIPQAGKNLERTWNQARTDLSNGLNRIDPRITQMSRDFDALRLKFQSEVFTGPALEQWLNASRDTARRNAQPVPQDVREVLRGWYPDDLFNNVRWKIGDGGAVNLANNALNYGHADAITLIDTIVFKNVDAASDFSIWAHEMRHVQQFKDWGVHSFAVQYMRSWNSVENPAYEVQNRFIDAWKQQNSNSNTIQAAPPGPTPNIILPGPPPQQTMQRQSMNNVCVVGPQPAARCLLPSFQPLQSYCSCVAPNGITFNGMVDY